MAETVSGQTVFVKRYIRYDIKEGTWVEQHLKLTKDITVEFATIGVPIPEDDQVVTLRTFIKKFLHPCITLVWIIFSNHL